MSKRMPKQTEIKPDTDLLNDVSSAIANFVSEKKTKTSELPPKHYIIADESDIIKLDTATAKRFSLKSNEISVRDAFETIRKIYKTKNGKILFKIFFIQTLEYKLRQLEAEKKRVSELKANSTEETTVVEIK